ncbi:hypothetical protein HY990_07335 [Candidatus Micrarchaeota archaeon]|nr:hypothetical protein [Candidatus Micrarchaeota archaeon]
MAKWVGYEYVEQRAATIAARTNPNLLSTIRKWGYEPLTAEKIDANLREMVLVGVSPEHILQHAGWGLICDGEGLWPSGAFSKGIGKFKQRLGDAHIRKIVNTAGRDPLEHFVMSLSCPEGLRTQDREMIETSFNKGEYDAVDLDTKRLRTVEMIASYLASEIEVPWKKDNELAQKIRSVLVAMWNFSVAKVQCANEDTFYRSVREYNEGAQRFDSAFNIFSDAEPLDAMRLNIEIANQPEDRMRTYIANRFEKVARMLARLQARGHNTSIKFTASDYEGRVTYGTRFCIYVPTCAIEETIDALKKADLASGELDKYPLKDNCSSAFRLPELVVFRSTGEGGSSSFVQATEALGALNRNEIDREQLNFAKPSSRRYIRLEDGTRLDLFENESD